jgi:LacI family transcriptional regulator
MVTRSDVALAAGTSTAVVSYVVNGGPRPVAVTTRARVLRAIDELGYEPNGVARALRSAQTKTLGLVLPDHLNAFFGELSQAVEEAAFKQERVVLLGNARERSARASIYIKTFLEQRVEGLILVNAAGSPGLELPEGFQLRLKRLSGQVVIVDRKAPNLDIDVPIILVDNEEGGYQATRHLVEHGYDRIGCLAGQSRISPAEDRTAGWKRALREAGLKMDPSLVRRSRFVRSDGYSSTVDFLRANRPPRALFVESDEQAIGALRAAAELGARVPDDLAIVSFDGVQMSGYTTPRLTTVAQPIAELGRLAVERALERPPHGRPTTERLPVKLVIRESCGCG